jgi:uncharacterized membrane protein HdeD (DUF308 family)
MEKKTERSVRSPPAWMRALRIGIGAVSIVLSLVAIAYPGLAIETAVLVVSIILVMLGVEQIIGGIFHYKNQRAAHVGIGILIIIALAIAAIAFPVFAVLVIITLAAVALLFSGISSILAGVGHKKDPIWPRAANIGVGALAVVISGITLISPIFGALLVALMIAIALLVYGMRLIVLGVSSGGRRQTMTPTASPTDTAAAA